MKLLNHHNIRKKLGYSLFSLTNFAKIQLRKLFVLLPSLAAISSMASFSSSLPSLRRTVKIFCFMLINVLLLFVSTIQMYYICTNKAIFYKILDKLFFYGNDTSRH